MSRPCNILAGAVLAGGAVVVNAGLGPRAEAQTPREKEIERQAHERGVAEGMKAGRKQGQAEGRQAAQAELGTALEALTGALRGLAEERRRLLAETREGVLHLALAVARKIVHGEVEACGQVAERVLHAAIERAQDATVVRVRVNPRDKAAAERVLGGGSRAELVADPAVSPGGCLVETDCGCIDASVESQWDAVRAALAERGEQSPETGSMTRDA